MDKFKRSRLERIRGLILYFLVRYYPAPIDHHEIRCFLDDLRYTITEEELTFHIAYMEERGFIKSEIHKTGQVQREVERATANGILVINGKIKDDGIDVESLP